jgi:hypothetical protein
VASGTWRLRVEWLDWNEPPLFKSFLRFDGSEDELTVRCFAATGCRKGQHRPPVEDTLRATRRTDGTWGWEFREQRGGSAANTGEDSARRG